MGLKVLHLIDSGGLYGAEKMLLALVSEQIKQGLEPLILSAGEPAIHEKPVEVEARRLGLPIMPWRMKPGLNLREAWKIIVWAREHDYALMHSHGYKFNILAGLWPSGLRRIPLVTTLHGYVHARRFTKMWLYEMLDRFVLSRMAAVILVNEGMKSEVGSELRGSGRVHVIPNGIGVEDSPSATEGRKEVKAFLESHHPVILGVGRLSDEKAFDRLLYAFADIARDHSEAGLLILGEGKQRSCLETLIHDYRLTNQVLLPGFHDDVKSVMRRSQVLVIPSKTEGLPITLLEAMSVGLPVVASRVGAIPGVLGEGQGGWLTDGADHNKLVENILSCLEDTQTRDEKITWSNRQVQELFSATAMAKRYSDVYQRLNR